MPKFLGREFLCMDLQIRQWSFRANSPEILPTSHQTKTLRHSNAASRQECLCRRFGKCRRIGGCNEVYLAQSQSNRQGFRQVLEESVFCNSGNLIPQLAESKLSQRKRPYKWQVSQQKVAGCTENTMLGLDKQIGKFFPVVHYAFVIKVEISDAF